MATPISKVTDLERITEGDVVLFISSNAQNEVFLSKLRKDHLPYVFGGFATLSREERYGKQGILERRYGFDVYGFLMLGTQEELFFEQGNPRYEQLYDPVLRKSGR